MSARLLAILVLASRAAPAAQPAGLVCPVPRSLHGVSDDAPLRAARDNWQRPPDCCGVVIDTVRFSAAGVVCWPLLEGDEVEAQSWPAAIVLFDENRIFLGEGSRLKLDAHDQTIRIIHGMVSWKLARNSKRRVAALDQPLGMSLGMAQLQDGKLRVTPGAPFPNFAPDLVELIRRFPYSSGRLILSDQP